MPCQKSTQKLKNLPFSTQFDASICLGRLDPIALLASRWFYYSETPPASLIRPPNGNRFLVHPRLLYLKFEPPLLLSAIWERLTPRKLAPNSLKKSFWLLTTLLISPSPPPRQKKRHVYYSLEPPPNPPEDYPWLPTLGFPAQLPAGTWLTSTRYRPWQ